MPTRIVGLAKVDPQDLSIRI